MVRCAILGAKGYTGCELIRILLAHPETTISFLGTRDEDSIPASQLVPQCKVPSDLMVETINVEKIAATSDVVFLALPHTKSVEFVKTFIEKGKVVIDLSADYRLQNVSMYETWYKITHPSPELVKKAVYGMPEWNKEEIKKAQLIANPGCYPTATILALLPLLKRKLISLESVIVDAKSGVSGAGKKLTETTQFCEVYENFSSYKVNQHQHMPEIKEVLFRATGEHISLTFVPHLLPINRGILATVYVDKKPGVTAEDIRNAFCEEYQDDPFVRIKPQGAFPQIKDVAHTNYCDIGIWADSANSRVIIVSAIDNLVKGASGQAIHNLNIRYGFDEEKGLI